MRPELVRDADACEPGCCPLWKGNSRLIRKTGTRRVLSLSLVILSLLAAHLAHAAGPTPAGAGAAASAQQPVETHATVRSIIEEDGGQRIYIRLKLVQLHTKPFTTFTYRVADRALLAGIAEGSSVAFTAARAGGENMITSLRPAEPCVRFQPCK